MENYKVKFLSDFEFNNLPYKYLDKDDIGLADRKIKTAFVRKTGVPVMDQFVAAHEIEHLVDRYNDHDDLDGIAHKKGGFARTILPTILGGLAYLINPALGAAVGAASNIGMDQYAKKGHPEQLGQAGKPSDILGAGALGALSAYGGGSALKGGIAGGTKALPGFFSKASGIAKGAVGGLMGQAPASTTPVSQSGSMLGQGFNASQAALPGASTPVNFGGQVSNLVGGASKGLGLMASAPSMSSNLGFGQSQPAPQPAPATQPPTPTAPKGFGDLSNNVNFGGTNMNLQPSASQGLGFQPTNAMQGLNTAVPTPGGGGNILPTPPTKTPVLESILGADWRKTLMGAALPMAGQFFTPGPQAFSPEQSKLFQDTVAMVKSGAQVQLTPAQMQAITANYDNELNQARQNLMDRYRYLRPGSDVSNDTQMAEAMRELESDYAEKRANALASAQLGLSAQQTQMMGELANMEINTLSQKAGISAQESQQFKEMLSSLGYMVATSNQMFSGQTDERMKADAYKKYQAGDRSPEVLRALGQV